MSLRYNSFIVGVLVASVTWAISLFLYWRIAGIGLQVESPSSRMPVDPDSKSHDAGSYKNSDKLLSYLQQKAFKPLSVLDQLGMVRSVAERQARDEGYRKHAFNTLVSERIGPLRKIPDTRHPLCARETFDTKDLTASVVICFYNEHPATLFRTVHSVLNRSSSDTLFEVVLVDDCSDQDGLHDEVRKYVSSHFPANVMLLRTPRREGLIRARMFGASASKGKVLVFLDSHVEVNEGWLSPLLTTIADSPTAIAVPIIDIIGADTFEYKSSPLVRGGFNWGLHFKWDNLPPGTLTEPMDFIKPIKSPTMAGGLFAIQKDYFHELGEYDSGMNIWGGENLEISFRVWMCGGSLWIVPCSRVGHVFRKRRPYGSPTGEDTMTRNSLRVAHVWMDEYKDYFLKVRPDARDISFGDISERQRLRQRLGCKSFKWYMDTVYPELGLPEDNDARLKAKWAKGRVKQQQQQLAKFQPWHSRARNYTSQFLMRLNNTNLCAATTADDVKTRGVPLVLKPCLRVKGQIWYETDRQELVLAQLLCLTAKESVPPRLGKCHEMGGDQEWRHVLGNRGTPVYNMAAGMCLAAENNSLGSSVVMKLCSDSDPLMRWDFVEDVTLGMT
ncbi:polypeptide N-acetylgalactosaminyltransferase 35A [Schistocerca cancellata]|uniref:polypeptide N-acetylgalactosaminyltransferase 35A n=1 Tax=Schistocerca cancellata TaxID=274614 RepID=UPI0021179A53|nr:polypeptide N-acetylgalactosaminyltransferase 35A [Schistocerca cancellata]